MNTGKNIPSQTIKLNFDIPNELWEIITHLADIAGVTPESIASNMASQGIIQIMQDKFASGAKQAQEMIQQNFSPPDLENITGKLGRLGDEMKGITELTKQLEKLQELTNAKGNPNSD